MDAIMSFFTAFNPRYIMPFFTFLSVTLTSIFSVFVPAEPQGHIFTPPEEAEISTEVFEITDEYGDIYTWEEFNERVLKFNGGIRGVEQPTKIEVDTTSQFYDHRLPEYMPISHFDYKYDYYYVNDYFADEDGYEFDKREFS